MKVMFSGEKAFMEENMDVFARINVVSKVDGEDIYGTTLLEVTVECTKGEIDNLEQALNDRDDGRFGGAITL